MIWKWLGALLLFPVQMVYLVVKAAVCMVLPPKLRDLSGDNVLVTGGGQRHRPPPGQGVCEAGSQKDHPVGSN
ncbi:unnamed protein product [Bubo scandiacus]